MSQTFACLVFFYHVGVLLVFGFSEIFSSFFFQRESVIISFFFFSCLLWVFVVNDRARCQQQTICKACYGARWASQLLLQFWIPPAYAKLAVWNPHSLQIISLYPWWSYPTNLRNGFFLSSPAGGCCWPYTWIISGIFYGRGWSVLKHKQYWEFDLGNTTFSINILLNSLS